MFLALWVLSQLFQGMGRTQPPSASFSYTFSGQLSRGGRFMGYLTVDRTNPLLGSNDCTEGAFDEFWGLKSRFVAVVYDAPGFPAKTLLRSNPPKTNPELDRDIVATIYTCNDDYSGFGVRAGTVSVNGNQPALYSNAEVALEGSPSLFDPPDIPDELPMLDAYNQKTFDVVYDDLEADGTITCLQPSSSQTPCTEIAILTPNDGAQPQSQYLALTGIAPPNIQVYLLLDGQATKTTNSDDAGHWEQVLRVEAGTHTVLAQSDVGESVPITVTTTPPDPRPLSVNADYTLLKTSDIILTHGLNSPQVALYGPTYTHAAIFIGGDSEGAATIAEAVPEEEAGGRGEVRSVPIELSTVWSDGTRVAFFRPQPELPQSMKEAVSSWVKGVVNRGLHYWSPYTDLSLFPIAYLEWSIGSDAFFQTALEQLDDRKFASDRFICSTLVWRAYLEGTSSLIDLSQPNSALFGGFVANAPPDFLEQIRPHFVFPDTIGLSTRVVRVVE